VRYWLHGLLFLVTFFTTTIAGASLQNAFDENVPYLIEHNLEAFARLRSDPVSLLAGLPFALVLLTILLAHEFGHYVACVHYRVEASLPYFLPAPTLTGTFGAFIRIRSPIYTRRALFDIGVAGPFAGFLFVIPALALGIALSKVIPGVAVHGTVTFGTPALVWLAQQAVFPGVPSADIYLHPIARAAWIGLLATALNLLPIGQLDGGHILYSLAREKHRLVSRAFIALLIPLGYFHWWVWYFWAAVLFFLGMRHPVIFDPTPLGRGRLYLGLLALAVFVVSFTLAPVVDNQGL
jgi:membrane-associated protease RseP (regulator of RpoE activity)